jgi:lysozyme
MQHSYLEAIKSFEGFTPQAKWDYAQHSNGYGTKALYPGEAITPEEAERRFAAEIAVARSIVEKHAAGWDEGTKAALTSLTFNAGTRWIASGLGDAVRNHDIEAVRERFVQYTKAQGEVLPGLVKRRLAELDWIGAGLQGAVDGATAVGGRDGVSTVTQHVAPTPAGPAALVPGAPGWSCPAMVAEDDGSDARYAPRDDLAARALPQSADTRGPQSLSLLITLLFDLQMRAAQLTPGEGSADHQERTA